MMDAFRDPLAVAGDKLATARRGGGEVADCCSPYLGAVSTIGLMVWSAAAGALAIGIGVAASRGRTHEAGLLVGAFCLTTLLCLDDAFMVHERPNLVGSVGGETLLFPVYAALALSYLLWSRAREIRTIWLLGLAGSCLAGSMLVDKVVPMTTDSIAVEDSLKLFGIFFWAAWHGLIVAEVTTGRPLLLAMLASDRDRIGEGLRRPMPSRGARQGEQAAAR